MIGKVRKYLLPWISESTKLSHVSTPSWVCLLPWNCGMYACEIQLLSQLHGPSSQRITKVRATFSLEEKDYTLTPMSLVIGHLKASFITENQKSATHIPHHGQYGRVIHSTRVRKCLLDIKMGIRDRQENSLFIKQLTLCLIWFICFSYKISFARLETQP